MLKLSYTSIARHTKLPYQLVVHVNEGTDGTLQWIKQQSVDFTNSEQNIGISKSINQAYEKCCGEYIVYLNDDMYVLPGWEQGLYDRVNQFADREPCYVSGTMVEKSPISPVSLARDYGTTCASFDEARLLGDHQAGRLNTDDWNGATWPPSCVHRKWWDAVNGYSEEFPLGFLSDIDFSAKLWRIGCRRFYGIGSSLVYHFSESTTSRVRGKPKNSCPKQARIQFLRKWQILPSTFRNYYLNVQKQKIPQLQDNPLARNTWELLRLAMLRTLYGVSRSGAIL